MKITGHIMGVVERALGQKQVHRTLAYQSTFATPQGREVLLDLIASHNVLNSSFDQNALEMARKEGERNVVLRILAVLKTDPEQIKNLIREADNALQINDQV